MYYTGCHPLTNEKLYVPKSEKTKRRQFGMMMWHRSGKKASSGKHFIPANEF
jgi:hypothetical protein